MAVLVTRPHPDDEATASALRARGFEVLRAPMLRFEAVPFHDDADARYGAVIVTSANALRAIGVNLADNRLLKLPLFAVGEHTASAARDAGFAQVIAASGGAGGLRDLVLAAVKSKQLKIMSNYSNFARSYPTFQMPKHYGAKYVNSVRPKIHRLH